MQPPSSSGSSSSSRSGPGEHLRFGDQPCNRSHQRFRLSRTQRRQDRTGPRGVSAPSGCWAALSLRCFPVANRSLRQFTDNGLSTFGLVPTDCRGDPVHIEIVSPADRSSDLVEVVDDRVTAFHAELPDGNSSGVQMMGGRKPSERQTSSMVPRMVAFARCLQFQVKR